MRLRQEPTGFALFYVDFCWIKSCLSLGDFPYLRKGVHSRPGLSPGSPAGA